MPSGGWGDDDILERLTSLANTLNNKSSKKMKIDIDDEDVKKASSDIDELASNYKAFADLLKKDKVVIRTEKFQQEISKIEDRLERFRINVKKNGIIPENTKENEAFIKDYNVLQEIHDLLGTPMPKTWEGVIDKLMQAGTHFPDVSEAKDGVKALVKEVRGLYEETIKTVALMERMEKTDFSTSGKRAATEQLKKYANTFNSIPIGGDDIPAMTNPGTNEVMKHADGTLIRDSERRWSEAGLKAGMAYVQAIKEAIKQGVAQSNLEKYVDADLLDPEELKAYETELQTCLNDWKELHELIGNKDTDYKLTEHSQSLKEQMQDIVNLRGYIRTMEESIARGESHHTPEDVTYQKGRLQELTDELVVDSGYAKELKATLEEIATAGSIVSMAEQFDKVTAKMKELNGGKNNKAFAGLFEDIKPVLAENVDLFAKFSEAVEKAGDKDQLLLLANEVYEFSKGMQDMTTLTQNFAQILGEEVSAESLQEETKAVEDATESYEKLNEEKQKANSTSTESSQESAENAKNVEREAEATKESNSAKEKSKKLTKEQNDLIKEEKKALRAVLDLEEEIAQLNAKGIRAERVKELETELARDRATLQSKQEEIEKDKVLVENAKRRADLAEMIAKSEDEIRKSRADVKDTIITQIGNKSDTLGNMISTNSRDKKWTQDYIDELAEIQRRVDELRDKAPTMDLEQLKQEWKEVADAVENAIGEKTLAEKRQASEVQLAKLEKQIAQIVEKNSAMGREFQEKWKNLKIELNAAQTVGEVQRISAEINSLQAQMAAAGKTGQRFIDLFAQRLKSLNATFLSKYLSFYDVIRYAKSAFGAIKELDTALIDLRKTTTMTADELNEFYYSANDVAKQMGVSTEEIINQAAAWSRLGYSGKDAATEMAALSSQFAQISPGMSLDNATDGLVSTMKAFHIDVVDAEREIMDNVNVIGNKMATTNDEVVEMLKRSSAAMNAANNSLENTIALEAAAVQITRNAETTGTAFRTISMRIRGLDEETEEAMEDFDMLQGKIADLTKTAKTPGGISLFKDKAKTEYKSTYELLKEISTIYHDLTDKEQAGLLEALAGKRGGQVLAGILDDFSEVERAMSEMENAAGAADREMGIIEQSWQYKLNNLKQTWIGLLQDLIDRGVIADLIDSLTKLSEALIKIIEINPKGFLAITSGLAALFKFGDVKKIAELFKGGDVLNNIASKFVTVNKSVEAVSETIEDVEENSTVLLDSLTGGASTFTTSMNATNNAVKGLGISLTSLGKAVGIIGAIVTIAWAAKKAFDAWNVTAEEVQEEIDGINSKISSLNSEISQLESVDYKNSAQQTRLDLLKDELRIQEELLAIEQRRKAQELSGNNFSDSFDKDNWNQKLREYQYNTFSNSDYEGQNYYSIRFEDISKEYKSASDALKKMSAQTEGYKDTLESLYIAEDDLANLRDEAFTQYADLTNAVIEMDETISSLDEKRDAELIQNIKGIKSAYQKEIDVLKGVIDGADKALGTYNYSSFYNSLFQHADLKGAQDYLVGLGKEGKISVERLEKEFPNLIKKIEDAGGSAEDLYNWLMNIADPLKQDRLDFANRWRPSAESRGVSKEYEELFNTVQKLSDEQFEMLMDADIDWSTFDAKDVLAKIQEMMDEAGAVEIKAEFSNQDFSENLTSKLKSLQASYDSFYENIKSVSKEDLAMDIDEIESLRKELVKGTEDEHGNKTIVGVSEEDFKEFEKVVLNSASSIEEMQDAYDKLGTQMANSYFDNVTEELQNVDDATKQLIKDQLELKGYTEESVDKYVEYKTILHDTAVAELENSKARQAEIEEQKRQISIRQKQMLADASRSPQTYSEGSIDNVKATISELQDYLKTETARAAQLGVDMTRTVYMNVDTNSRQILSWTQENVDKFEDALLSWVEADKMTQQEMQNYLNQYLGSYSTVDAMSGSFGVNGQNIDIAFTPILNTPSGPAYLDQATVTSYINAVLSQVEGEITPAKIQAIDAEGLEDFEYQGERIKGLIASIGDEAELVSESMHFTGATGSIERTAETIEELQKALDGYVDSLQDAGKIDANFEETVTQINALRNELLGLESDQALLQFAADVDTTTNSLLQYTAQLMVANDTDLNSEASVAQLQNLMASSGLTTEVIAKLIEVMQIYQTIASGVLGTNTQAVGEAKARIADILNEVSKMQAEGIKLESAPSTKSAKKAGGGAGKAAGDAYKEAFEKELEKLKNAYERGKYFASVA